MTIKCQHYYILSWCLCLKFSVLSLPMSTVDCERAFSVMNLTKTSLPNRMLIPHLSNLMMISINDVDRSSYDFNAAFQSWSSKNDSRIANVFITHIVCNIKYKLKMFVFNPRQGHTSTFYSGRCQIILLIKRTSPAP